MTKMRAKMTVRSVQSTGNVEILKMAAVAKKDGYPADGSDEDNTFALWTPQGEVSLTIANPKLFGQFKEGDAYYVDFTSIE